MVSRAAVAAREAFAMHGSLHESVVEEVSAHENHRARNVQTRSESVFFTKRVSPARRAPVRRNCPVGFACRAGETYKNVEPDTSGPILVLNSFTRAWPRNVRLHARFCRKRRAFHVSRSLFAKTAGHLAQKRPAPRSFLQKTQGFPRFSVSFRAKTAGHLSIDGCPFEVPSRPRGVPGKRGFGPLKRARKGPCLSGARKTSAEVKTILGD